MPWTFLSASHISNDDNEVIIGIDSNLGALRGLHTGAGGPPNDDGEGTDGWETESSDDNNDKVFCKPGGGPYLSRGLRCACGPENTMDQWVLPSWMCIPSGQSFQQKMMKMYRVIFYAVMIGWVHRVLQRI